jgi:diguanylate cyclase (GGDEF)-like protein
MSTESPLDRLTKRLEKRNDQPVERQPRANSYSVMVVDDEQQNVEALERLLRDRYQVRVFTEPEAAESALRKGEVSPDLVITDQRMPKMSGVDLLEKVRELKPHCMRLILTGYTEKTDLVSAINRGQAYRYLTKPWKADELMQTIEQALDHYQLLLDRTELADRLQASNIKLADANQQLEQLIQQRTLALRQVSEELRLMHDQLAKLAVVDPLTGLHNHRFFQEHMAKELRRCLRYGQPMSLILADLDHFRQYNELNGHQSGDQTLKVVSDLFKAGIREPDMIARYGGEELVILLPHTGAAGAETTAQRLRKAIESHPFPGAERLPGGKLTASFGIAGVEPGAKEMGSEPSPSEVMSRADKALAKSKQEGRNRVTVA